jgi:hypothetical protein
MPELHRDRHRLRIERVAKKKSRLASSYVQKQRVILEGEEFMEVPGKSACRVVYPSAVKDYSDFNSNEFGNN